MKNKITKKSQKCIPKSSVTHVKNVMFVTHVMFVTQPCVTLVTCNIPLLHSLFGEFNCDKITKGLHREINLSLFKNKHNFGQKSEKDKFCYTCLLHINNTKIKGGTIK